MVPSYLQYLSPILLIATYKEEIYFDGSEVAVCFTSADTLWSASYFISSITVFFLLPLAILVVLYAVIARQLLERSPALQRHTIPITSKDISQPKQRHRHQPMNCHLRSSVHKYRKQIIFMLVTVVASFFICLLPFRALTLWIIVMPPESIVSLGIEGYYNILYFSRIMLYLNSALNPILYNLMSSKFRNGFCQLIKTCLGIKTNTGYKIGRDKRYSGKVKQSCYNTTGGLNREGTIFTNSMSTSSCTQRTYLHNSSITTSTTSADKLMTDTKIGATPANIATIRCSSDSFEAFKADTEVVRAIPGADTCTEHVVVTSIKDLK